MTAGSALARSRERTLGWPGMFVLAGLLVAGTVLASADPFTLTLFATYALVGGFLAFRRPRSAIGWLLVGIGFGFISTTTFPGVDTGALARGTATTRDAFVAWLSSWSGWAVYLGFLALTIIFPTGRLPETRGRRAGILLLTVGLAVVVLTAAAPTIGVSPDGLTTLYVPNPYAVLPDLVVWSVLPTEDWGVLAVMALLVVGVIRMVLRYRRSTGIERLQLRWLVAALSFVACALGFGLFAAVVLADPAAGAGWIPALIAFPMIPLSIGVAVMRYRLYEIDRIVSRTIGWLIVTAVLAAVFVGAVVGLQAILAPVTENNTLAVAGSTLLAAGLFQPLRRRVQRAIDRRFNRARVDGERAAEAFARQLRDTVDLLALRERLLAAVDGTVEPSRTVLWIRGAGQ